MPKTEFADSLNETLTPYFYNSWTVDEEARDYLPHLYGYANYIVISDIKKLPYKISNIYRKLTT